MLVSCFQRPWPPSACEITGFDIRRMHDICKKELLPMPYSSALPELYTQQNLFCKSSLEPQIHYSSTEERPVVIIKSLLVRCIQGERQYTGALRLNGLKLLPDYYGLAECQDSMVKKESGWFWNAFSKARSHRHISHHNSKEEPQTFAHGLIIQGIDALGTSSRKVT